MAQNKPLLLLYYPPGYGLESFARAFSQGKRSEASHWSMHLAQEHGFGVVSSRDFPWPRLGSLVRKATYRLLWFDLPHLLANWRLVRRADLVWAMSEREMIPALIAAPRRVRVVGEIIWILDEWNGYAALRRALLRPLLRRAAGVLVMTGRCREVWQRIMPEVPAFSYLLGVPVEAFAGLRPSPGLAPGRADGAPVRILAMGNDGRRDWTTLADAFGSNPRFEVIVATGMPESFLAPLRAHPGITIDRAADYAKVRAHLAWADMLVMPVLPNEHGAGLTTLLEAAAGGLPILCTRVGGIDEYLSDEAALYVSGADAGAMRDAALSLAADPGRAAAMAVRAKAELSRGGYDSATAVAARCAVLADLPERLSG